MFTHSLGVFIKVDQLETGPYRSPKPKIRYLEDYAIYTRSKLGTDGKENKTDGLISRWFGMKSTVPTSSVFTPKEYNTSFYF